MSEHDEQAAVVRWFKLQYPKYKDCILAIPNGSIINTGGKGGSKGIGRLKWLIKEGFKTGVSDLFIAVPRNDFGGLWIEMKDVGKKERSVTKPQMDHLILMREVGYDAEWCAGFEEAKRVIETYFQE